jgi:hypothetical protein
MGIEAVWKDESGHELARVGDPRMLLSRVANGALDLSGTVCLKFLDAYGNACFNQFQIPVLTDELEAAAANAEDHAVKEHLLEVAKLARDARKTHTYLWFIGD